LENWTDLELSHSKHISLLGYIVPGRSPVEAKVDAIQEIPRRMMKLALLGVFTAGTAQA